MDNMSPVMSVFPQDLTQCDATELTANLFKDHKPSIDPKVERLNSYLRIRCLNNEELQSKGSKCYQSLNSKTLLVIPPKGSNACKFGTDSDRRQFSFSQIFDETSDQISIYENCALPIVKRFLLGENGLLFAYGVTSSGKSFTMRGTTASPGIIPRALNTVFEVIGRHVSKEVPNLKPDKFCHWSLLLNDEKAMEDEVRTFIFDRTSTLSLSSFRLQLSSINRNTSNESNWNNDLHSTFNTDNNYLKCYVWITFYEIYNESIYDLLEVEITGERKPTILLLKDENQNYYIKGLRQIPVSSSEEAYKVLLFGQNNLHISSTDLNKKSSRSHCVFKICLITVNTLTNITNVKNLAFCDLAGAERGEKTNNTGERIKEAGNINKSLLALSRCLSNIRLNQLSDKTKQRFVNFRDSKLTKVFQPFLSGIGIASMISNMNPNPTLFDETFFALKFTAEASQVVVSTEEQRNKLQDSLKRLTQVWMQSSGRWSNFAHINPPKPSFSIIQQTIVEEDDEDNEDIVNIDDKDLNKTYEELNERANRMDFNKADPQEMEILRTQLDFLTEKLKQSENDKLEMEVQVRKQVVDEFNKLIRDMEDMAEDKDKSKKRLEAMMTDRLKNAEIFHKEDIAKKDKRINDLENELFRDKEELLKKTDTIKDLSDRIQRLENQNKNIEIISEKMVECKDSDTSTIGVDLVDRETSFTLECADKCMETTLVALDENQTSTSDLYQMCDIETMTDNDCNSMASKVDKSISTNKLTVSEVSTSPLVINKIDTQCSPSYHLEENYISNKDLEENYVSRKQFEELKRDHELELRQKDAVIEFNRDLANRKDCELKQEKQKNLNSNKEINLNNFYQHLKPSSVASSIGSHNSDDTNSITSATALALKDRQNIKPSKYSSRKKNFNLDSTERRYLSLIGNDKEVKDETLSQSSNNSEMCEITDEIGNTVYSTTKDQKKANKRRQKFKKDEDLNKGPESKRKKPLTKTASISPISPIPTEERVLKSAQTRVTRSKARKAIKF